MNLRAVLAIAATEIRRFSADRSNIFFVFIFPLALVFVLGSQFGGVGNQGTVALVGGDSALHTALVDKLEGAHLDVSAEDLAGMQQAVARGGADVGVVVSDAAVAAFAAGQDLDLQLVAGSGSGVPAVMQLVQTAGSDITMASGQEAALVAAGVPAQEARGALEKASAQMAPATLMVEDESGLAKEFAGLGGMFDLGAAAQLLLFVFLTTLSASVTLVQARRNGVIRRALAAPVTASQAITGLAIGRLGIGLFQGLYIMIATRLLFGVEWGNLWAMAVILTVFGLVAAGAAMVIGVLVDNEGAATGLAVGGGLILAAIGGCMLPLELFPDTLQKVAHLTPHAWAYDAIAEVQRRSGGVMDVLPELGVLALMALGTLVLGAVLLRRSLERAM